MPAAAKSTEPQLPIGITEEDKRLVQESVALAVSYQGYTITTDEQLQEAAEILARIKGAFNRNETRRKKITGPLDLAKKAVMDLFRPATDKLTWAETVIKSAIRAYQMQKVRELREAQEKADRERRDAEEAERKRLAEQADEAALLGDTETAAQLTEAQNQVFMPAPPPPPEMQPVKIDGLTSRKVWKARVVDFAKLPDAFKVVNEKALNDYAKATAGKMPLAGVEFYEDTIIGSSAR